MLTAVLLHAAPSCIPAEASPAKLPVNFVHAAALVMRVLNNVARSEREGGGWGGGQPRQPAL